MEALTLSKQLFLKSIRERTFISNEQYHEVCGVGNFSKSLTLSGISKRASHLIAGFGHSLLRQVMNRLGESGLGKLF